MFQGAGAGVETVKAVAMVDTNFSRIAERSSTLTNGKDRDATGAVFEAEMTGKVIEVFHEVSKPAKTNFTAV